MKFTSRTIALGFIAISRRRPRLLANSIIASDAGRRSNCKISNWPTFRANQNRTGSLDSIGGPSAPKILWTFREGAFTPSDFSSSPAVVGNRIYVASANVDVAGPVRIYLLPRRDQRQRIWQVPTQQEVYCSPPSSMAACMSAKACTKYRLALPLPRRQDRRSSVQFKTNSHAEGPPTIKDGRVYFGAGDDGLYCLDAITGKQIWQFPAITSTNPPSSVATFSSSAPATTAPAISPSTSRPQSFSGRAHGSQRLGHQRPLW